MTDLLSSFDQFTKGGAKASGKAKGSADVLDSFDSFLSGEQQPSSAPAPIKAPKIDMQESSLGALGSLLPETTPAKPVRNLQPAHAQGIPTEMLVSSHTPTPKPEVSLSEQVAEDVANKEASPYTSDHVRAAIIKRSVLPTVRAGESMVEGAKQIGRAFTEPVPEPAADAPLLDKVLSPMAGVGKLVSGAGKVGFGGVSALMSSIDPEVSKVMTVATNAIKATDPSAKVAPEVANGSILDILGTPGAVSTGSPTSDAIVDETAPLAVFGVLGDLANGVKPKSTMIEPKPELVPTKPVTEADINARGRMNAASQDAGMGDIHAPIDQTRAPELERQFDAMQQGAKQAAETVKNAPEKKVAEAEPTVLEGTPRGEQNVVSNVEGPKQSVRENLTGEPEIPADENTPVKVAERGFAINDKRAVQERVNSDTPISAAVQSLQPYAKRVVSDGAVKRVELVGSTAAKGVGNDVDMVYDLGNVGLPKDEAGAVERLEQIVENSNIDTENYDAFFKADDRYFHLSSGAGRAITENTDYAQAQAGKPRITLAEAGESDIPFTDRRRKVVQNAAQEPKSPAGGKVVGYNAKDGLPVFDFENSTGEAQAVEKPKAMAAAAGAESAPVQNNASGESPASLEAQARVASEKKNDVSYFRYRRGVETPIMPGVDASEMKATAPDEVVVRRTPGQPDVVIDGDARNYNPKPAAKPVPAQDTAAVLTRRAKAMNLSRFMQLLKEDDKAFLQQQGIGPAQFWQEARGGKPVELPAVNNSPKPETAANPPAAVETTPEVSSKTELELAAEAHQKAIEGGDKIDIAAAAARHQNALNDAKAAEIEALRNEKPAPDASGPWPAGERIAGHDGKETRVRIPGKDQPVDSRYRVVEMDSLTPSHSGLTYGMNERYPVKQDRGYHNDKAEQAKVEAHEQKFDPTMVVNTNPDAVNGPSIVTPDGMVLGGNSRVMTLQRLYNSGRGNIYRNYLADNAESFGVSAEQVRGMKNPVLVREVASPKTIAEGEGLITDYNKTPTGSLNPQARAVALGKRLTPDSVGRISDMLRELGDNDKPASVADLLRERPNEVLDILRKDGAVTEEQVNGLIEQTPNGIKFTDDAKSIIGDAMLGNILNDADLVRRTPLSVKNKIESVLGELMNLKGRGEDGWNIVNAVKQAADDIYRASLKGMSLDDYYNQGGLFGDTTSNPLVEAVAKKLLENQKSVKAAFRQFVQDSRMDEPGQGVLGLIAKPEPNTSFADAFGGEALPPDTYGDALSRAWTERNGTKSEDMTMGMTLIPPGLADAVRKGFTPQAEKMNPAATAKLQAIRDAQNRVQTGKFLTKDYWEQMPGEIKKRYYDKFADWRKLEKDLNKNGVVFLPEQSPDAQFDIVFGSTGAKMQKYAILMKRVLKEARDEKVRGEVQDYLNLMGYQRAYDVMHERLAELRNREAQLVPEREAGKSAIRQGTKAPMREARNTVGAADELSDVRAQIKDLEDKLNNGGLVPEYKNETELHADLNSFRNTLGPTKFAQVQVLADKVFDLNRKAWDMAHDGGLISDEVYQQGLRRGKEYIPLERIMEQTRDQRQARFAGLDLKTQKILRKIEGSEITNVNGFSASLNRITETIREVERNKAGKVAVNALQQMNQFAPDTVFELKNGASAPHDMGVISYYENGKVRRFAAPKMLADSLELADATMRDATAHIVLSLGRQAFRTGATGANIFFSAVNVIKDQKDFLRLAKHGIKTPADFVRFEAKWFRSVYDVLKKNDRYVDMLDKGFLNSTMQRAIDPQHFLELQTKGIGGKVWERTIGNIEEWNNALEEATKISSYQTFIDRGMNPTEAAIEARRFGGSPDFARSGYDRTLDLAFMFANANIQGLGRVWNRKFGITTNPRLFAGIAGGVTALMANNLQYKRPDGSREWDHISQSDKDRYYNIIMPYTFQTTNGDVKHGVWKIPKGHTDQLLDNALEMALEAAITKKIDVQADALRMTNNILPGAFDLKKGQIGSSLARGVVASSNPIIKGTLNQVANTNTSTGGAIVPKRMEDVQPTEQFRETTSPTAKWLGGVIDKLPGVHNQAIVKNLASPLRIEQGIRDTFAGVGESVLALFDALHDVKEGKPKVKELMEADETVSHLPMIAPLTRRFVGSTADQVDRDNEEQFFTLAEKSRTAKATFSAKANDSTEAAQKWSMEHPDELVLGAFSGHLQQQTKLLADLRKMQDKVMNSGDFELEGKKISLTVEQRKQTLKAIHDQRVKILQQQEGLNKLIDLASEKIAERKVKGLPMVPPSTETSTSLEAQ